MELPGLVLAEPAYAGALDWLLCDGLARIADPDAVPESLYLRLSTRPIDQAPFEAARRRIGDAELRRQVIAGGYRLRDGTSEGPVVNLFTAGAVMPEVLQAQDDLNAEGVHANVFDVTSLGRLYRSLQGPLRSGVQRARVPGPGYLAELLAPHERRAPIVTIHDAASHAMAWLGSVYGARLVALGVDSFGQSGSVRDIYRHYNLSAGHIVNAALCALETG